MRKLGLVSLFTLLSIAVTGCAPAAQTGTLDRSGIWGKFVGLISDGLDYFANLVSDYGISILIVTLIIRIIIFPLMFKQLKHTKLMQEMQPEMTKLREKHKNDPQKMNQEMMKLFQEKGTNPLAGCFPIVIQMPILIALYQAITFNPHIKQATTILGGITLGHPEHFVLPALAALTTYVQTKMTMANATDPQQKMMLYIMPAMIFFFSFSFPAALSLYWVFGNILTITQYYFLKPNRAANQGGSTK